MSGVAPGRGTTLPVVRRHAKSRRARRERSDSDSGDYPERVTDSPAATPFSSDLELALRLADAADTQSLPRFDATDLKISTKADESHVTDADLATENAIRVILHEERPADGILGEEYGTEGDAHRQWIIDPIDGTANFLRGVPLWGTMISLAVNGIPQVGVVSMPALGRRWWACTGGGSWTASPDGPQRLQTSTVDSFAEASVSFQSITQWADAGHLPALLRIADAVWRDRAYGDVFAYMLLAEGRLEMVAEFDVKEYDIAAAVPIIREAGGTFTSFDGVESISARSTLASNSILHEAFLALAHTSAQD